MEEERREHVMKMKKMEAEMEQVFEMKVKEKKQKLKDSEAEVGLIVCASLYFVLLYRIPLFLLFKCLPTIKGFFSTPMSKAI